MAYQTYITEALVCGSFDSNTSDRSFLLFTKEAGMIYAHAKSVREERSKQRYALQVASHVRVTLIRGKSGWKIAGAEALQNFYAIATTREGRTFLRNILRLLRRVVHGETSHTEIFTDVVLSCQEAHKHPPEALEQVLTLRILHALGYIAPAPSYQMFLHCALPLERISDFSNEVATECTVAIEHALIQSQL